MAYDAYEPILDVSPISLNKLNGMLAYIFKKLQGGIGTKELSFTHSGDISSGANFVSDCFVNSKLMWHNGNCTFDGTATDKYIRFANGLMICTKQLVVSAPAITTAWGSMFKVAADLAVGAYPGSVSFLETPAVVASFGGGPQPAFVIQTVAADTDNWGSINLASAVSGTPATVKINFNAVGKWK